MTADSSESGEQSEREPCKWGEECYNNDPKHRKQFKHPEPPHEGGKRVACKWGSTCYRKHADHLAQFAHPGDRNYRVGLVIFKAGHKPEFESLWQLFQFYDPDESGHLSKEEFAEALTACQILLPQHEPPELEQAWKDAQGPIAGYVNFRQFVAWTQEFLKLEYPLGLESGGSSKRPCRFRFLHSDERCSCPGFEAVTDQAVCACGHKPSMHRSDMALRTVSKFFEDASSSHWDKSEEGLVKIVDPALCAKFQELLNQSHKPAPDNWTRDRGCKNHGVRGAGCTAACKEHRRPVPKRYHLLSAYRNQNQDLWQKYSLVRTAIAEECKGKHDPKPVVTSGTVLEVELDPAINEWQLFHGSSASRCKGICSSNFRLALAGTGATWKEPGKDVGTPLYGFGIYLAERITKADEYAEALTASEVEEHIPSLEIPDGKEVFTVLLCRVIGGRTNVVTTNEIEVHKLRKDVFEGSYNSVFGDRVSTLNKPYREIVVYDKDQCYPEFLLAYTRSYD